MGIFIYSLILLGFGVWLIHVSKKDAKWEYRKLKRDYTGIRNEKKASNKIGHIMYFIMDFIDSFTEGSIIGIILGVISVIGGIVVAIIGLLI